MEKRVYRQFPGKGLSYLLLFLSAVVVLSGLLGRGVDDGLVIGVSATETPIPTDEAFDETMETREWTLPGASWCALQLGSFDTQESAQELAAQFRPRGAAGYVWVDQRWRTLAALYETKEDANAVRTKLWETHGIDAFSYVVDLPPMELRMQGMKGQLDILQAAFVHAHGVVAELQALSILLDRQETTVPEAKETLQSLNAQVGGVNLRLKQRFAQPVHETVRGLTELFDSLTVYVSGIAGEPGAVELATQVKYQALDALYRLKTLYDGLSVT